jgi:CNT family concentrative nucleoside transporter
MSSPVRTTPSYTPYSWRIGLFALIVVLAGIAYAVRETIGERGQAVFGIPSFLLLALACSTNLRAINWRTVLAGVILQLTLALLILRVDVVYQLFQAIGAVIQKFLDFTDEGARFVFGSLADPGGVPDSAATALGGGPMGEIARLRHPPRPFLFAFKALPAVIFVSSFFTVLYYLGVLQFVVKVLAKGVVAIMGTSGAETLSAIANVFMGQTEAPLIVKPYVSRMTRSELLALMIGGMATISGGVMVAYIGMMESVGMGQDGAVSILATSVMAAPCGLYIAKILVPETEQPETRGDVKTVVERTQANVFEAAAEGASEGMKLVLNIAAMLIAFIALVALIDHVLLKIDLWLNLGGTLKLQSILGNLFAPIAFLMGVPEADAGKVGSLLGTKLALNEFVAYVQLTSPDIRNSISPRSFQLSVFALTGFANFASIGIQLGGIGAMAPERRSDLARLGLRALLGGFLATLINAAVAGLLMSPP